MPDKSLATVYYLWDDRLKTSQKVTHFVWRKQLNDIQRLTIDISYKKGRPEASEPIVQGEMISVGLDHNQIFYKLAVDQKVNFTNTNQVRTTIGIRF
jgi:hypothetical protein